MLYFYVLFGALILGMLQYLKLIKSLRFLCDRFTFHILSVLKLQAWSTVAWGMSWSVWSTWREKRRSGKRQRKRPLQTLPVLNVANIGVRRPNPVGNVMLLIEHLGFLMVFICRFGKPLLNHLTFAILPFLADSEWRRSCCHEAALVISTDRRGDGTRGPWHTTATSQQVRQTTHNLLHPVFHVFDMFQFAATVLLCMFGTCLLESMRERERGKKTHQSFE